MERSLERAKASLSEEEQEKFDAALLAIAFEGENLFSLAANPESAEQRMRERLDGKTVDEILAAGERILEEERERERQRAEERRQREREGLMRRIEDIRNELEQLEEKKQKAESDRQSLRAFVVESARFSFSETGFTRDPVIELSVRNETSHAISRAYFQGVLATPGRAVPWVDESFNYSIRGGLEPGESANWRLSPNMFGPWASAPRDRDDLVLTVEVTRIDGADGNSLYDARFSERDLNRIESLVETLGHLRQSLDEL